MLPNEIIRTEPMETKSEFKWYKLTNQQMNKGIMQAFIFSLPSPTLLQQEKLDVGSLVKNKYKMGEERSLLLKSSSKEQSKIMQLPHICFLF